MHRRPQHKQGGHPALGIVCDLDTVEGVSKVNTMRLEHQRRSQTGQTLPLDLLLCLADRSLEQSNQINSISFVPLLNLTVLGLRQTA